MRKLLRIGIIAVIAVIVIVGAVLIIRTAGADDKTEATAASIVPVGASATDKELTDYAREILIAIGNRDYAALSGVAHSDFGVIFSPYATVNLATDRCFTASQIAAFGRDNEKYIWGVYNVGGEPIEMTPAEYFDDFVFDADFTKCENFGIDEILRSGNALENIAEIFPNARFVDCYMPGNNSEDGSDWQSLRLVFEEKDGKLWLTAIIHSEYTI